MTPYQAIIAGALQGVTEFLPISSSGHLLLLNQLFGISSTDITFETVVHFATFLAIGIFFKEDIRNLTKSQLKFILISSLPIMVVGFFIKDYVDQIFSSPLMAGFGLLITGVVLLIANLQSKRPLKSSLTPSNAAVIGIFQAIAILPGVSRSGLTVSGALISGINRNTAFSHAFLTGFVVIAAATGYQLISTPSGQILSATNIIGFVTAFSVGLGSLKLFQYILTKAKLSYFGIYCLLLGTIVIAAQAVY